MQVGLIGNVGVCVCVGVLGNCCITSFATYRQSFMQANTHSDIGRFVFCTLPVIVENW